MTVTVDDLAGIANPAPEPAAEPTGPTPGTLDYLTDRQLLERVIERGRRSGDIAGVEKLLEAFEADLDGRGDGQGRAAIAAIRQQAEAMPLLAQQLTEGDAGRAFAEKRYGTPRPMPEPEPTGAGEGRLTGTASFVAAEPEPQYAPPYEPEPEPEPEADFDDLEPDFDEPEPDLGEPEPERVNAGALDVLGEANRVVAGDRARDYGENSLPRVARYWSEYLGLEVTGQQVADLMMLLKIARQSHSAKRDNLVDIAGYAALGGQLYT